VSWQKIEIDVRLNLDDYLRANYWFLYNKIKPIIFILLFVGVYAPLHIWLSGAQMGPNDSYWGFFIPWGILIFLIGGTYLGSKRQLASHKAMNETHHYTFLNEGINSVSASTSAHQDWDNIREAVETKTNFLLFIALNQMYIIPKRCFQNEEQIDLFRDMLKRQLSSRAKIK
jgi:hypothetical protein